MSNFPFDQPPRSDFKTFWSVFEATQQRKKRELAAQQEPTNGETETRHRIPKTQTPRTRKPEPTSTPHAVEAPADDQE